MPKLKPQSAKAKGRELQKWIMNEILTRMKRFGLVRGDVISRSMGSPGIDIMMSPLAQRVFPVSIEAKSTTKHPTMAAWRQADKNKYPGTIAAVVWKPYGGQRSDSLILLRFRDFANLVDQLRVQGMNVEAIKTDLPEPTEESK